MERAPVEARRPLPSRGLKTCVDHEHEQAQRHDGGEAKPREGGRRGRRSGPRRGQRWCERREHGWQGGRSNAGGASPGQPPPGDKGDVRNEEEPVRRAPRDSKDSRRHNQRADGCANAVAAVHQVEKPVAPRERDGRIDRTVDECSCNPNGRPGNNESPERRRHEEAEGTEGSHRSTEHEGPCNAEPRDHEPRHGRNGYGAHGAGEHYQPEVLERDVEAMADRGPCCAQHPVWQPEGDEGVHRQGIDGLAPVCGAEVDPPSSGPLGLGPGDSVHPVGW